MATFSPDAAQALLTYHWPLNVRELEKAVALALVLTPSGRIDLEHLGEPVRRALSTDVRPPTVEREHHALPEDDATRRMRLLELLREHAGNVSTVARITGKAAQLLQRTHERYALATQCIGGGQGIATVLERV